MMRYCPAPASTPTILPAKLTTVEGEVPIRRVSAQDYARTMGSETKTESWHGTLQMTHSTTPRSLYPEGETTWQQQSTSGNAYRITSHTSLPHTTLAERLQSTSEVSRRLNSVSNITGGQEGQSLNESSGIIYCPEKASMDLTLAGHVTVPYPASVPRFQAPLYISPSLAAGYVSWETLMTQAEAFERASEERELLERDDGIENVADKQQSTIASDGTKNDADPSPRDQFPIPPSAVLDDS